MDISLLKNQLINGDTKALARAISLVENEVLGYVELMKSLKSKVNIPVIGITGPPGAGKSTLLNQLLTHYTNQGKNIGVLAVDPTSPFNFGSLLGDRIRMAKHFNNDHVFIRSLATRGSLGGLSEKVVEIIEVMKAANFDLIIVETVGVGQSEVEIAGLADITVVVLVPESGDEIQNIKSGLMEIADIFVVNKADRAGADLFTANLQKLLSHKSDGSITPIIKTIAEQNVGINELALAFNNFSQTDNLERKVQLLTDKALRLIARKKMKSVDFSTLKTSIEKGLTNGSLNLYELVENYQ